MAVKRAIPRRKNGSGSGYTSNDSRYKFDAKGTLSDLGEATKSRHRHSGLKANFFGSLDRSSWKKRREDFVSEMRHLSKIRHPCITTVLGEMAS